MLMCTSGDGRAGNNNNNIKRPPEMQIRQSSHRSQSDLNKCLVVSTCEQTCLGTEPSRDEETKQKKKYFSRESHCLDQATFKQQSSVSQVTPVQLGVVGTAI